MSSVKLRRNSRVITPVIELGYARNLMNLLWSCFAERVACIPQRQKLPSLEDIFSEARAI